MMKQIFTGLRTIFRESSYRLIAVVAALAVAYVSYWLLMRTTTPEVFLRMMQNGEFGKNSLLYGTSFIVTTFLIIALSGISVATMVWFWRHSQFSRGKSLWGNAGGLTAAMFGMGCPVCGAFLLSAIGVAGGFTVLPFQGLELKFFSLGLLAASTAFGATKAAKEACEDCTVPAQSVASQPGARRGETLVVVPLEKIFLAVLTALFLVNSFLIPNVVASLGSLSQRFAGALFGASGVVASTIIAPKLNPDGKTTSLVEQSTITEVPANPNTGDHLADAKVVMIPTGVPFYAPEGVSFDDPINAQNKWGAYENSITLSGDLQTRYNQLIGTFTCNYCCGGPTNITTVSRCGCRHAKAWRGFFKYMLQNYGDQYTDEQLKGEAFRWSGIWYPAGVLQDYLLATGNGAALPHKTHGGAGAGGQHGL